MADFFSHGYAVVVGAGGDLPITVNDAQGIANFLRAPDRCAYPSDQVQLLVGQAAQREAFLAALDRLADQVVNDSDAIAVVYFSGHGLETPAYHLMPFGYNLNDLLTTAISGIEFTEKLRGIQSKKLLVLLDCCHAGGIGEAKGMPHTKSPAPPGLFDEMKAGSGRVIIASSRKDELSWAYQSDSFSAFTTVLLQALAGYGAFEQDGYARVLDVAMWLGRKVPERTGDKQHPIIKVSNLEDNFVLAYYAGGAKTPRTLEWDRPVPTISGGLDEAQIDSWQRILANYRESMMLMDERMSEYVEFTNIPLDLIKNKRRIEAQIADLERKSRVTRVEALLVVGASGRMQRRSYVPSTKSKRN